MAKRVIWTCVTMVLAASILLSGVAVFNRLEEKILSTGDELHLLQNTDVVVERSFFPGEDLLFSRPPWTEYEPSRCHPLGGLTERLADPDALTLNVSQPEDSAILSTIVYLGGSNEDIATLLQECEVSESGNYYWQGVVLHHGITVDAAANPDGDLIYLHIRPLSNQVVTATQASLEIARVEKMVSQFSAPVTDYLARLNNTLTYRGRAGYFGFLYDVLYELPLYALDSLPGEAESDDFAYGNGNWATYQLLATEAEIIVVYTLPGDIKLLLFYNISQQTFCGFSVE